MKFNFINLALLTKLTISYFVHSVFADEYECVLIYEDFCKNEYLLALDSSQLTTYFRRIVCTSSYYYPMYGLNICSVLSQSNEKSDGKLIHFDGESKERIWIFIPVENKNDTFFIKNFLFKEYLYPTESFLFKFYEKNSKVYTWKYSFDKKNEIFMWKLFRLGENKYKILNVKLNTTLVAGSDFFYLQKTQKYQRNIYISESSAKESHWTIKCKFDEDLPVFS